MNEAIIMSNQRTQIIEIGHEKSRLIIIDEFEEDPFQLINLASSMGAYLSQDQTYYPGVKSSVAANIIQIEPYFNRLKDKIRRAMFAAYGHSQITISSSSFSMITLKPEALQFEQVVPHTDGISENNYAILHYLSPMVQGGTGFYRHKSTGYEIISGDKRSDYLKGLAEDVKIYGQPKAQYIDSSTDIFEKIYQIEGRFNRLVIYPTRLLHSGLINEACTFSDDPRKGRLTANIFVTGK